MTKFSNKWKKPCFWPILGPFFQFWAKTNFSQKIQLCHAQLHWVSSTMPNFRKNLWYNSKKMPEQKDGWKDRRTDIPYFIGPFRLLPGSKNWLTWRHADVHKNKEKKIKNQHCLLSMLAPQIEYLYYPLNVEGVTQKSSLLPGKTNNNINNNISFSRQERKSTETLIFPTSSSQFLELIQKFELSWVLALN